jgi:hypothetical protein
MSLTVLNYSASPNDQALKARQQKHFWSLVGAAVSFTAMVKVLMMICNPLRIIGCLTNRGACGSGMSCSASCAMRCWRNQIPYSVAQQTLIVLCGLLVLFFIQWLLRRHPHSSSFARGALIGGLLPGGVSLCLLVAKVYG